MSKYISKRFAKLHAFFSLWPLSIHPIKCLSKLYKVIVHTVLVYIFQSVTIHKTQANNYNNTFYQQYIDQYTISHNISIWKLGSSEKGWKKSNFCWPINTFSQYIYMYLKIRFIWKGLNGIQFLSSWTIIQGNTVYKFGLQEIVINNVYDKYFI